MGNVIIFPRNNGKLGWRGTGEPIAEMPTPAVIDWIKERERVKREREDSARRLPTYAPVPVDDKPDVFEEIEWSMV